VHRTVLSILLLFVAPALAQHADHEAPTAKPAVPRHESAPAGFTQEMSAGMNKMMADMHLPGYTGNPDIDFLAMMIPHHEGAVEMARLVLVHGRDPLTRQLAADIIASQVVEIEAMRRRLGILKRSPPAEEFPALGGTRGPVR
jgi:uncharacterized protein (DUF305 family)